MKKIICLFLALSLFVCAFTACSKTDSSDIASDTSELKITIDSHYSTIDESAKRAYEKLCTAVLNGDNEVKFNTAMLDTVNQLFYTSFPLYPLVKSLDVLDDSTGCKITYVNDADTHKKLVEEFTDKISSIIDECSKDNANSDRYLFNVYTYITSNFKTDNSVISAYDALVQGKGFSAALSSLFEYIVLQGGGKASHVLNNNGTIISMAEFKNKMYFFNPALDIEKSSGKTLSGFAMNSASFADSFTYTDGEKVEPVTDKTYQSLSYSKSFKINGDSVEVECNDTKVMLDFK